MTINETSTRKPKTGEAWTGVSGGRYTVAFDTPDDRGRYVFLTKGGYVVAPLNMLSPPKMTLGDLPNIPEYWHNVYSTSRKGIHRDASTADKVAAPDRIARVRLVPDPDGIVACNGREVLE